MSVEMKTVTSSNIEAVGYDESAGELHVRFKNNKAVYVYPNVSKQTYDDLAASPSVGSYFDAQVKKKVDKRLVRKVLPAEEV